LVEGSGQVVYVEKPVEKRVEVPVDRVVEKVAHAHAATRTPAEKVALASAFTTTQAHARTFTSFRIVAEKVAHSRRQHVYTRTSTRTRSSSTNSLHAVILN
jgi:hypothetical protein